MRKLKIPLLITIIITIFLALYLSISACPPPPPINPDSVLMVVYSNFNYTGDYVQLTTLGDYDLDTLQSMGMINDSTSSIKIKNGYTAVLYQNFHYNTSPGDENGWKLFVNQDIPQLTNNYDKNLSSLKLYSSKDCPTPSPEPTLSPIPTITPIPTIQPSPTITLEPSPTLSPEPTITPIPTLPPTGAGGMSDSNNNDNTRTMSICVIILLVGIFCILKIKQREL